MAGRVGRLTCLTRWKHGCTGIVASMSSVSSRTRVKLPQVQPAAGTWTGVRRYGTRYPTHLLPALPPASPARPAARCSRSGGLQAAQLPPPPRTQSAPAAKRAREGSQTEGRHMSRRWTAAGKSDLRCSRAACQQQPASLLSCWQCNVQRTGAEGEAQRRGACLQLACMSARAPTSALRTPLTRQPPSTLPPSCGAEQGRTKQVRS